MPAKSNAFRKPAENVLGDSTLADILDALESYIYIKGTDYHYLFANRAVCDLVGRPPEAIIGARDIDLFDEATALRLYENDRRVIEGGERLRMEETNVVRQTGISATYLSSKIPLRRGDGSIFGLCGISTDITLVKRMEQRERTRGSALELLAGGAPLQDVLEGIVRGVEAERGGLLCSILLVDESGRRLLCGAAPSLPKFYNDAIHGLEIGDGVGSCGTSAFRRERVVVEDIRCHAYWVSFRELADLAEVRSCWCEPILASDGRCLGTFAMYQRGPAHPSEADLQTIARAASLVSVAIEHFRREQQLLERDRLLRKLSEQVPGFIYQYKVNREGNGCFPYASEAIREIYELTPEQVQHSSDEFIRRLHADDLGPVRMSLQHSADTLQPWHAEFRVVLPQRGLRWREGHALPERLPDSSVLWHGYVSDITERKRADLALRASEQRLRLLAGVFEHAQEGILITGARGRIMDVNRACASITGYEREELVGRSPRLLQSDREDSEFYAAMRVNPARDGYWRGEIWNRRKNGESFAGLWTISAVKNAQGETQHFVGLFSDITSLKEHQQRLEYMAHYDALTQLPNRVLVADRVHREMAEARRSGKLLAVCYLDLDGFKPVNDSFGHKAGDQLLIEVAKRLKDCMQKRDIAARLGGDEFVLLLCDLESVDECKQALSRILAQISRPYLLDKRSLSISASVGVTLFPLDDADSDTLVRHADQSMYLAKQSGRNGCHLFDPDHDRLARARHEAIARIETALRAGEFRLYYQPKLDMRRGRIVGVEALIRWLHPERGLLTPSEFLPIIEHSDFSIQ